MAAAAVALAGAALLFEQSPANEIIRTNAGLSMLKRTGNAVAVGLTVATITIAIELGSSLLITLGLHAEGGAVKRLKQRMQRKSADIDGARSAHPRGKHFAPAQPSRAARERLLRRVASIGTM